MIDTIVFVAQLLFVTMVTYSIIAMMVGYSMRQISAAETNPPSLDDLAQRIREWGAVTFPTSTPESTAEHLRREIVEILKDPTDGEEQADAFFLVVQLARVSGNDLAFEVARKMEINLSREWQPADELGVVEHVRGGEAA